MLLKQLKNKPKQKIRKERTIILLKTARSKCFVGIANGMAVPIIKTKKGNSKYIPLRHATKIKIKAMILHEFGHKMKALGMQITDDLKFI